MGIPLRDDPLETFHEWLEEAKSTTLREPTAMTLATIDEQGKPDARMVLLKHADARGFVFYTNLGSPKARQLVVNPAVALCFYWTPLGKQIRVQGIAELVDDAEADAYFRSRDRKSQIGAWASKQSQALTSALELERRAAKFALKFGISAIPRPEFWSGYRVVPSRIEFWLEKPFRLHDRLLYERTPSGWTTSWLFP